jgi:hypothetical protein
MIARRDHRLERLTLELHGALHRVHQVRDQVVAPLELDIDLLPGVGDLVLEVDQAVVRADHPEHEQSEDDEQCDEAHGFLLRSPSPETRTGRR